MAGGEPQKGDKVSWKWGNGSPSGTVAEKKEEGHIAITSKRGNTIKKNASPGNPAVHIERSGNDVVKRASEVTVDKRATKGKGQEARGEKRKADSDGAGDTEGGEREGPRKATEKSKEANDDGQGTSEEREREEADEEEPRESAGDESADEVRKETKQSTPKSSTRKKGINSNSKSKNTKSAPKVNGKAKNDAAPRREIDAVSSRTRSHGKQ